VDHLADLDKGEVFLLKRNSKELGVDSCFGDYRTQVPVVEQADRQYVLANLTASLWFGFSDSPAEWSCLFERAHNTVELEQQLLTGRNAAWFGSLEKRMQELGNGIISGDYYRLCISNNQSGHVHEDEFEHRHCLSNDSARSEVDEPSLEKEVANQWRRWLVDFSRVSQLNPEMPSPFQAPGE
jgi:hypothetical protein